MRNDIDPNVYSGRPHIKKVAGPKKTYWYYHHDKSIDRFRLLNPAKWPSDVCIQDLGEKIAMSDILMGDKKKETSRLKLGSVLKSYMKIKKPILRPSSYETYLYYCKKLLGHFGGRTPIKDIDFAAMQAFTHTIDGAGYANSILAFTKCVWADLQESRMIKHNDIINVPELALVGNAIEEWSEGEIKTFQDRWQIGTWERRAFEVLLQTGCRSSDALRLGPRNLNGNVFFYTSVKTGVRVKMHIGDELLKMLSHVVDDGLFFIANPRNKRKLMSYPVFSYHFKMATGKAKVDKCAHGLRKTFAIRLATQGMSAYQIQGLGGWRSEQSVTQYIADFDREIVGLRATEYINDIK